MHINESKNIKHKWRVHCIQLSLLYLSINHFQLLTVRTLEYLPGMFMLNGGMNGGGIPGGPMPIGAAAIKPGGIAPGVKPIWDTGGNAGGGIIGGAIRVLRGVPAFGES